MFTIYQDNSTEEEIWKEGFGICFTAGVPSAIKELCFLCGSKGTEKVGEKCSVNLCKRFQNNNMHEEIMISYEPGLFEAGLR